MTLKEYLEHPPLDGATVSVENGDAWISISPYDIVTLGGIFTRAELAEIAIAIKLIEPEPHFNLNL